jgi:hypothetical protein
VFFDWNTIPVSAPYADIARFNVILECEFCLIRLAYANANYNLFNKQMILFRLKYLWLKSHDANVPLASIILFGQFIFLFSECLEH